jgi:hypothetical protein
VTDRERCSTCGHWWHKPVDAGLWGVMRGAHIGGICTGVFYEGDVMHGCRCTRRPPVFIPVERTATPPVDPNQGSLL